MIIKIKKQKDLQLPFKKHELDSCYDIYAAAEPKIVGEPAANQEGIDDLDKIWRSIQYLEYSTNLYLQPEPEYKGGKWKNFDILIYPRSSISNTNLILANSVGTGDPLYRGEYKNRYKYIPDPQDFVFNQLLNTQCIGIKINKKRIYRVGDRIAQIRPTRVYQVDFQVVDELTDTTRGAGGFGSTNSK